MARKRNRFGESGLNVKINLTGLMTLLLLAACSSQPPAPVEDREVNARVREPASEDSAGVQVYSLQNPAVKVRSYDIGPRVGEICSRNWRTISVAREHLDDTNGASDAEARANQCMNTRPKGL